MIWKQEDIEQLNSNFSSLSDTHLSHLSRQLNRSPNSIRIMASRLGLKSHKRIVRDTLKLNGIEKQVVIGSLFGDLYCRKNKTGKYSRLEGGHCLRQKEYMLWKINILNRLGFVYRQDKIKPYCFYCSKVFKVLNEYNFLFYQDGKKQINRKVLDKLDKLGLLVWYMDDGNFKVRDKTSSLHTNGFSYEEQLIIKKWFEDRWIIFPKIYRTTNNKTYPGKIWYYLNFSVNETKKLHDLFIGFDIPNCMKYKFQFTDQSLGSCNP